MIVFSASKKRKTAFSKLCATKHAPPVVEFSMTGGVFMKKGTPHFLYTNKDSPDYVAPFAPFYSDRQKAILSGELSVEEVELR